MNEKLLFTSLFFGSMMIVISILFYNSDLYGIYFITYIGIITSCINHGLTNMVAKCIDRFIMVLSGIIYLYYYTFISGHIKILILFTIFIMVWIYFFSQRIIEKESRTYIHMTVHLFGVFLFSLYHFL